MLQLPSSAATASATEAAVVPGVKSRTPDALGKPSPTIDLTLFALVRGLDTLVRAAPLILASSSTAAAASAAVGSKVSIAGGNAARASPPPRSASRLSRLGSALSDQAEGLIFVVCCAQIMWAWFYHQERLPPTYVKWITNLATMDERLLLALRGMRYGQPIKWSYKDRDITPAGVELVSSLSEELGYPYEWGDPTRIPNTAAEARQMLLEARRANAEPVRNLAKVVVGAARSAAFLATFIVGNWYPICLARSHLPRLFPAVPFSFWDSGLGPLLGSIACGFSIFIEEKRKRAEMALYVAPRALFAVAESTRNGWLSEGRRSALWCERVIFGMAVGTVVATAKYRPDQLRGITGAMGWVVRRPGSVPAVKGRYARGR
ncbi:uncharacterized protein PFL1_04523 [Pseudozyma flocculosa PF-1]|uniref:Transmembrane protein 135 N-terminal domain-containing protein n=1 Tax=Pseudozyma flocculosa PF-1 TaxID=1277687 RepID=A0A061H551_9BASI|nr:uncharacterized protein PFL1_04523 [Pseudozyma flocculosa PF-1]EPQ27778.1 hypothetical protein PFL1_04523 [Pseudozyma flocculosa PF-1]